MGERSPTTQTSLPVRGSRMTWGASSRYFAASRFVKRSGGSVTWLSASMTQSTIGFPMARSFWRWQAPGSLDAAANPADDTRLGEFVDRAPSVPVSPDSSGSPKRRFCG